MEEKDKVNKGAFFKLTYEALKELTTPKKGYGIYSAQLRAEITDLQHMEDLTDLGQRVESSYFTGLKGLSAKDREAWETLYQKEILGYPEEAKESFFKNKIFTSYFQNSTNPQEKELWENRMNLTREQKDIAVARRMVEKDGFETPTLEAEADSSLLEVAKKTLNNQVLALSKGYLEEQSSKLYNTYYDEFEKLDSQTQTKILDRFNTISADVSPHYSEYLGTRKLDMTIADQKDLLARFNAWAEVGGEIFATERLRKEFQDRVAENQGFWEKTGNTGHLFVDNGAGMILRLAGMTTGLVSGIWRDEGESYWNHVLDNDITKYADGIATTQSWKRSEQLRLEELGLQKRPILETVDQLNSLFTKNTIFNLLGQYGFTAATTLASFGGAAVVNGAVKTASAVGKAALGTAKGLNATKGGIALAKGLIKSRDIGNFLVVGSVASAEGAMNAVQTKNDYMESAMKDAEQRWVEKAEKDIEEYGKKNPLGAYYKALQLYPEIKVTSENAVELLKNNPDVFKAELEKYRAQIDADKAHIKELAERAMYIDFTGQAIINGFINTTLKASLNAPSIQKTLRKVKLTSNPLDKTGITITGNNKIGFKAIPKKYTKGKAFLNRTKESLGEGLEEYNQELSGAFSKGIVDNDMKTYVIFKYGTDEQLEAYEKDIISNFEAGLRSLGETAVSFEAIKSGVYGALSTFIGGPNVNSRILSGQAKGGKTNTESTFSYLGRKSPIGWRSGIAPLFDNASVAAINQEREEIAKGVNDFFEDKDNQDLFFNINSSVNWINAVTRALKSGNQKAIRDARTSLLFSNVATLESLEGTAYHDAVMESLNARINFKEENLQDPESTESKAVFAYQNEVNNKTDNLSAEEALAEIKKSSKDLLDIYQRTKKEKESVEKLFGKDIDKDVKDAIIYNKITSDNYKERANKIEEELQLVRLSVAKIKDPVENSGLNKKAKYIISTYGTIGNALKKAEELQKAVASGDKTLEELKSTLKTIDKLIAEELNAEKKKELKNLKIITLVNNLLLLEHLTPLKEEAKKLTSSIQEYLKKAPIKAQKENQTTEAVVDNIVLSALEIMELAPEDRKNFFEPEIYNELSEELKEEVDKILKIGVDLDSDFLNKIVDVGLLTEGHNINMKSYLQLIEDPNALNTFIANVKDTTKKRLLNKKYQYITEFDENKTYEEFSQELDKLYTSEIAKEEKDIINNLLNKSGSKFYQQYKDSQKELISLLKSLESNEEFGKLDENSLNMFEHTLKFLTGKRIPYSDVAAVTLALLEQDEDGAYIFEKYIENINKGLKEEMQTAFTSIPEAIQTFKDVIKQYITEEEERKKMEEEVKTEPVSPKANAPKTEPSVKVPTLEEIVAEKPEPAPDWEEKKALEKEKKETVPSNKFILELFADRSDSDVVAMVEIALNLINSLTKSEEVKELAIKVISYLSNFVYDSPGEFVVKLAAEKVKLDIKEFGIGPSGNGLIRPGVAELFESNPELANKVYEALGYNVPIDIKLVYSNTNKDEGLIGKWEYSEIIDGDTYNFEMSFNREKREGDEYGRFDKYIDIDFDVNGTEDIINKNLYQRKERIRQIFNNFLRKANQFTYDWIRLSSSIEQGEKKAIQRTMLYKRVLEELGYSIESVSDDKTTLFLEQSSYADKTVNLTPQQKQQAQQLYSQYLDTIFPDGEVSEMDNSLYISVLNQLEQENKIEKDCSGGNLKAKDGIRGKFTKGSQWEIVKDLKGYPSHSQGGVDVKIGKNGFSFTRDNGVIEAKHGLVLPNKFEDPIEFEAISKVLSQRNKHLNWVDRGLNPDKYPKIDNKDDTFSTHRLAYSTGDNGEAYVYPTIIQNDKGKLEQLDDNAAWEYAKKTKTAMRIPNVKLAEYYSKNGLIKH